eukprot:6653678-Alexandrium_andersonii.AAC.1
MSVFAFAARKPAEHLGNATRSAAQPRLRAISNFEWKVSSLVRTLDQLRTSMERPCFPMGTSSPCKRPGTIVPPLVEISALR